MRIVEGNVLVTAEDEVSEVLNRIGKNSEKLDKNFKKLDKGSKKTQGHFRNLASSAAIMEGPLGQVAGRINAIGAALGRMNPLLLVAGVTLTATTIGLYKTIKAGAAYEAALLQIEAQLKATGNASGVTVQEIDEMSIALGRNTLASAEGAREAASSLLAFRSIGADTFETILKLAQDYTAVFGGELRSNVIKLGRAYDNPREGLQGLSRQVTAFSPLHRDMIADMFEGGEQMKAVAMITKALDDRIGGAGAGAAGGLSGSVDTLGENFNLLFARMGKGSAIMSVLNARTKEWAGLIGFLADAVADPGELSMDALLNRLTESFDTLEEAKSDAEGKRGRNLRSAKAGIRAAQDEYNLLLNEIQARQDARIGARKGAKGEKEKAERDKVALENSRLALVLLTQSATAQERYNEKIEDVNRLLAAGDLTDPQATQIKGRLKDPEKVEADRLRAQSMRAIEAITAQTSTQEQMLNISYLKRQSDLDLALSRDEGLRERHHELTLQNAKHFVSQLEKIQKKSISAEEQLWNDGWEGKTAIISQSIGAIGSLLEKGNKKQFELGKKLQIVSVIGSTAAGIGKALEYGFPLSAIIGAGVAATGAAQLATIKGLKYGGGGSITPPKGNLSGPQLAVPTQSALERTKTTTDVSTSQSTVNLSLSVTALDARGVSQAISSVEGQLVGIVQKAYTDRGVSGGPIR